MLNEATPMLLSEDNKCKKLYYYVRLFRLIFYIVISICMIYLFSVKFGLCIMTIYNRYFNDNMYSMVTGKCVNVSIICKKALCVEENQWWACILPGLLPTLCVALIITIFCC